MRDKLALGTCQVIVILSLVGVVWLAVLFSVMTYSFEIVNREIFDNEKLLKNISRENLLKTDLNHEHLLQQDIKLDKLLNQTSSSK